MPVFGRRQAGMFPEGRTEDALAGKSGLKTDILHRELCVFQQIPGRVQSCVDQVLMGREARLLFEHPDKMVLAQAGQVSQFRDGGIFRKMFADIGGHGFRGKSIRGTFFRRRRVEEKRRQDIVQIFGDQCFPYRFSAVKGLKNVGQLTDCRIRVGQGEYAPGTGDDVLVEGSGGGTVKVTPETFPPGVRPVGVRSVAVDQNKISGGNAGFFVLKFESQTTLFHIHQQKAVVGSAFQAVAGLIEKMSGADRIKKHFHRSGAGRVQIIIRIRGDQRFAGFHNRIPPFINWLTEKITGNTVRLNVIVIDFIERRNSKKYQ